MPPEGLSPSHPLPIITEETKQRLLEELGRSHPPQTREILAGIKREVIHPSDSARSLTENVFGDLLTSNRNLFQVLYEELGKRQEFSEQTDARSLGMAVVLRAFDIQSGYNLIPNLQNLNEEDLNLARKIVQETIPDLGKRVSILEGLWMKKNIPEQQIGLNDVVKEASKISIYGRSRTSDGAVTMYRILSHLWPKLGPNQMPPTPPPPQSMQ